MEIEINALIKHITATLFRTKGVYRYRVSAGSHGTQKSAPFPGFIFPLSGCAEYHFNDTPYLVSPGTVVHGPADVMMHKRVVGARELFESVSEYIHSHYMDPLSVSLLAQQSGINENRLYYIFQKYAGMGPGDYLRTYRLNMAREQLITSSVPVGTIAEQVGYPDPLHFSRIFKRHFGVSPSKFREDYRSDS